MTVNEAIAAINAADKGDALNVAHRVIDELSDDDADMVAGDLEEMALLIDGA